MKIECLKNKLIDAVNKTSKISGKNINLPILTCLLFDIKKTNLTIRSTNLDLGVEISIPIKSEEEIKIAIPAQIIFNFLNNLKSGEKVTLSVEDDKLNLYTDKNETIIKTQPTDDFPVIPIVNDGLVFNIESKLFIEGLKSVWYSASISSMKPELSSVYLYSEGGELVFVATDAFRLAEKKIKFQSKKNISKILIPYKNIGEIIRVLNEHEGEIEVRVNDNQMSIIFETTHITSRVVDGNFPDYKQIIPKDKKTEATILKEDLLNAVKLSNFFSGESKQIRMKLDPKNKIFEVTSKDNNLGEYRNNIDSVLEGDEVDMGFNYQYINDCFQSIYSDSISLTFNGERKPLIIKPIGDPSFFYLVMPMNK